MPPLGHPLQPLEVVAFLNLRGERVRRFHLQGESSAKQLDQKEKSSELTFGAGCFVGFRVEESSLQKWHCFGSREVLSRSQEGRFLQHLQGIGGNTMCHPRRHSYHYESLNHSSDCFAEVRTVGDMVFDISAVCFHGSTVQCVKRQRADIEPGGS